MYLLRLETCLEREGVARALLPLLWHPQPRQRDEVPRFGLGFVEFEEGWRGGLRSLEEGFGVRVVGVWGLGKFSEFRFPRRGV